MNLASLTYDAVSDQVAKGGRFARFPMVISLLVLSITITSGTRYVAPGKSSFSASWPYWLVTLLFGWWSVKGMIKTVEAIVTLSRGGEEVTYDILTALNDARPAGERVDRPRYV